jgi:hypothetical protein
MEDIILDKKNSEPKGEVPYGALLPMVGALLIVNIAVGAGKLTKGAEFSIVLMIYFAVVPMISSVAGLLIAVRPSGNLRFGQRWIKGSLIANIIIQTILFLFVVMI